MDDERWDESDNDYRTSELSFEPAVCQVLDEAMVGVQEVRSGVRERTRLGKKAFVVAEYQEDTHAVANLVTPTCLGAEGSWIRLYTRTRCDAIRRDVDGTWRLPTPMPPRAHQLYNKLCK